jgi:hypothetical protein
LVAIGALLLIADTPQELIHASLGRNRFEICHEKFLSMELNAALVKKL